ncbi:unnamed protein product [Gordionus sp. m RMFG-2023]|uniref:sorting nexin-4-like n=1 Tax=Gordionus sp. m RMFG-2023 TaxID=3053472 RepID=UPI0030E45CBB
MNNEDLGCLLDCVIISIKDLEHNPTSLFSLQGSYVTYLVKVRVLIKEKADQIGFKESTTVWRRYSDFEILREYLISSYPFLLIPPLPDKRVNSTLNGMVTYAWHKLLLEVNEDEEFLERRRKRLEKFLHRLASHPILCRDVAFISFLQEDPFYISDKSAIASIPSRMANGLSFEEPAERREVIWAEVRTYAEALNTCLGSFLAIRKDLREKVYLIHKIHGNYGRVFFDWAKGEKGWGNAMVNGGKLMTEYALIVDNFVSAEEEWEDNLREYASYSETLRNLSKNYKSIADQVKKGPIHSRQNQKDLVGHHSNGREIGNAVLADNGPIKMLRIEDRENFASNDSEKNDSRGKENADIAKTVAATEQVSGMTDVKISEIVSTEQVSDKDNVGIAQTVAIGQFPFKDSVSGDVLFSADEKATSPDGLHTSDATFDSNGSALYANRIDSAEHAKAEHDIKNFHHRAMIEIQQFKDRKERDMKTCFREYAQNQLILNKKSLDIWVKLKENFSREE